MTPPGGRVGVGMVGYAFMGAAHSLAWRTAPRVFELPLEVDMAVLCGRDADAAAAAAARLGWRESRTDWKELLTRDDVGLVDICTPGDTHAEIAIAALDAGKHVLCEKPLANSVEEAAAMAAAAARAQACGVQAMVGFNYRRVPAVALARRLVRAGRIGRVRQVRASYLQDWLVDPEHPLTWRVQAERAGSGALGDIGAHAVDLAQFVTGDLLTAVSGLTETFVTERPVPGGGRGPVTVDDAALFLGRFASGAVATFEASRFATGRKNALRLEVYGSEGALVFDFESMNELAVLDRAGAADPDGATTEGFRRVQVTEAGHPYVSAWWPPGHGLGYEHTFVHEIADLVGALGAGRAPTPTFADGLQVQQVLDAVVRSAASGRWTGTATPDPAPDKTPEAGRNR